jgi:protein-S-isoprenylcysteine O-methyltransferase Ste14
MSATANVLALCWLVFIVYWGVTALRVKRTLERRADWLRVAIGVVITGGLVLLHSRSGQSVDPIIFPKTLSVRVIADGLGVAGTAILLWARTILGGNWSSAVTLKEDHELIQGGPYAYVRHPIYSGMLLLALGTATHYATLGGFVLVAVCCVGFAMKMREEELLMVESFPERYPAYRARVKAIVPHVL